MKFSAQAQDQHVWQRFRRNLSIGMLGSGLSLAIKLAQTALLTSMLQIEDFGRVLIALNLFAFMEAFVGLRVSDVMFRFYQPLRERHDVPALQGLLILCLGLSLATGLFVAAAERRGSARARRPWEARRNEHGICAVGRGADTPPPL